MKKLILTLFVLILSLPLSAQWSNDIIYNNQLTEFGRTIYEVDVCPTSNGITYINYNGPDESKNVNTWLQILDEEGNKKFDGDGIVISDTLGLTWTAINERSFVDKDGNILMAVTDCRNSNSDDKLLSYSIYKISPEGEFLWGKDGLDLFKGMSNSIIACMQMIQLEDGSYIFAWMEAMGCDSSGYNMYGIKAERVSEDGTTFLWDTTMELSSSTSAYSDPYLENTGNNQFIMVYAQGTNSDVYARKINSDGSTVWETKVYVGGFNTSGPVWKQILTKPDPNGGVFIGWFADPNFTGVNHAYVQSVQADGTLAFADAVQLGYCERGSTINNNEVIDLVYNEEEDCIYIVWRGVVYSSSSYQSINIQKLKMNGELMWGADGILIELVDKQSFSNLCVQNADNGGVAVFYSEFVSSYGDTDLLAVKLDADGNYVWDGGIYEFSPTVGNKSSLEVSELINGEYWIASWQEDRIMDTDTEDVAYAERIYLAGPAANSSDATEDRLVIHLDDPNTLVSEVVAAGYYPATVTRMTVTGEMGHDDWALLSSNFIQLYDLDISGITATAIPERIFEGNTVLQYCIFPSGLEGIGENAFSGCSNLEGSFASLSGVTTVGASAFSGCTEFTDTLTISKGMTIGTSAFENCTGLTSILFKEEVTEVPEAFSGCTGITSITSYCEVPPTCVSGCFGSVDKNSCILEIPTGTLISYLTAIEWGSFINNYEIEVPIISYNLALDIGKNGVVEIDNIKYRDCNTELSIVEGEEYTFKVIPDDNCALVSVLLNGEDIIDQLVDNKYTLTDVQESFTLVVTFEKLPSYITFSVWEQGAIDLVVEEGSVLTVRISPADGWTINSASYNGVEVSDDISEDNHYTTPAIAHGDALVVTYMKDSSLGVASVSNTTNIKVYATSASQIAVVGTEVGDVISVYNALGSLVLQRSASGDIDYLDVAANVMYIVRINESTFKLAL